MKGSDRRKRMSRIICQVSDEKVADYLTKVDNLVYLQPFLGQQRSAKEASEIASVDIKKMHYQIGKMRKLGILRQTDLRNRAGSPIKFYQAVASEWFVGIHITPFDNLETFLKTASTAFLDEQAYSQARTLKFHDRTDNFGFWINQEDHREDLSFRWAKEEDFKNNLVRNVMQEEFPIVLSISRRKLSKKQATKIKNLLAEIYSTPEDENGSYYIFRAAFTPELS